MRYFTVDRAKSLVAGMTLSLTKHATFPAPGWNEELLKEQFDSLCPDGVSSHGRQYLTKGTAYATALEPNIELIWEYVRRTESPAAPSRFVSLFACDSASEAAAFAARWGQGPIWEVETESAFKVDMAWLSLVGSILAAATAASHYWRQEPVTNLIPDKAPAWEYLLPLPVTVVGQVTDP